MLYADFQVKSFINDEGTVGRLIVENVVVKVVREPGGVWRFGSLKILAKNEPPVNPAWRGVSQTERLPDFTEADDAAIFDAIGDALGDTTALLHLEPSVDTEQ